MKRTVAIILAVVLMLSAFPANMLAFAKDTSGYFLTDYVYDDMISSEDGTLFAYQNNGQDGGKTVFSFDENGKATELGTFHFENWYSGRFSGNVELQDNDWKFIELHSDGSAYSNEFYSFDENYFRIGQNGKIGVADSTGKVVVPCLYDKVWRLGDRLEGYFMAILGDKFGLYDEEGNLVLPVENDLWEGILADGLNLHLMRDGKYGVVDRKGNIIIPYEYDWITLTSYEEGYYLVEQNGLYGLLDLEGAVVLPVVYDEYPVFYDGVWVFRKNGTLEAVLYKEKLLLPPEGYQMESIINVAGGYLDITYNGLHGIINSNGDIVLPCEYHSIDYDGFAVTVEKNNQYGLSTLDGRTIVPCEYDEIIRNYESSYTISRDGKSGFVQDGALLFPCEYNSLRYVQDYDVAVAAKDGKYGLIKPDGTVLVDFTYVYGNTFSEGLWAVRDSSTWKMGYVDMDGKIVIGFQYDECFPFYDGIACARLGTEYYFIDKTGKVLSKYASANQFHHKDGTLFGIYENGLWGVYDALSGEVIIPCEFDSTMLLGEDYFIIIKDGQYGVLDYNGNTVLSCVYDDICQAFPEKDSVSQSVFLWKDGKRGYINLERMLLIEPGIYDYFWEDSGNLIKTEKEGKYGLLTWAGEVVLPCEYYTIYIEHTGLICFYRGGESGCMDQSGKVIVRCGEDEYFDIRTDDSWNPIVIEVTRQVNGEYKQGLVSLTGEVLLPQEYILDRGYFHDDSVLFARKDGKVGVIDIMGNFILPCEYEGGYSLSDDSDVYVLSKDGKYGVIDGQGTWVLPCEYDGIDRDHNNPSVDTEQNLKSISKDGKYGYIDGETGDIVFPCAYDTLEYLGEGRFFTIKENVRQVVTRDGTVIFESFKWASPFSGGLAKIITVTDKQPCFINTKGEVVLTFEDVSEIEYRGFVNGYLLIKSGEEQSYQLIDTNGVCVTPYLHYISNAAIGKNGIVGVGKKYGENEMWRLIDTKEIPVDIAENPSWSIDYRAAFGFTCEEGGRWGYTDTNFEYDKFYIGDGLNLSESFSFFNTADAAFYEVVCELVRGNASLSDDWLVFTGAGEVTIRFLLREKGTNKVLECIEKTLMVQNVDISEQPVSATAPKDRSIKIGDRFKEDYGWDSTAWVINNPRIGAAYKTETTNLTKHTAHAGEGLYYVLVENRTKLENVDPLCWIDSFTEAGVYREELFVQNPGSTEWIGLGSYEITVEEPVIEITVPDTAQKGDIVAFSSMLTNLWGGFPDNPYKAIVFDSSVDILQGAHIVTSTETDFQSYTTSQKLTFTDEGIVRIKVTYTVKVFKGETMLYEDYGIEPCDIGNYSISKIVTIAVGDVQETAILLEEDPDSGFATASNIEVGTTAAEVLTSLQNHGQVPAGYHASLFDSDGNVVASNAVVGTGMKIVFESEDPADNRVFSIVIFGDASGDGEISIFDIMAQRDHIFGKHRLEGAYLKAGKLDGSDEEINIFDIMAIRDHIFGKTLIAGTGEDL